MELAPPEGLEFASSLFGTSLFDRPANSLFETSALPKKIAASDDEPPMFEPSSPAEDAGSTSWSFSVGATSKPSESTENKPEKTVRSVEVILANARARALFYQTYAGRILSLLLNCVRGSSEVQSILACEFSNTSSTSVEPSWLHLLLDLVFNKDGVFGVNLRVASLTMLTEMLPRLSPSAVTRASSTSESLIQYLFDAIAQVVWPQSFDLFSEPVEEASVVSPSGFVLATTKDTEELTVAEAVSILLTTLFFQSSTGFTSNTSESKQSIPSGATWNVELTSYISSLLRAFPSYLASEESVFNPRELSHIQVVFSLLIDFLDVDTQAPSQNLCDTLSACGIALPPSSLPSSPTKVSKSFSRRHATAPSSSWGTNASVATVDASNELWSISPLVKPLLPQIFECFEAAVPRHFNAHRLLIDRAPTGTSALPTPQTTNFTIQQRTLQMFTSRATSRLVKAVSLMCRDPNVAEQLTSSASTFDCLVLVASLPQRVPLQIGAAALHSGSLTNAILERDRYSQWLSLPAQAQKAQKEIKYIDKVRAFSNSHRATLVSQRAVRKAAALKRSEEMNLRGPPQVCNKGRHPLDFVTSCGTSRTFTCSVCSKSALHFEDGAWSCSTCTADWLCCPTCAENLPARLIAEDEATAKRLKEEADAAEAERERIRKLPLVTVSVTCSGSTVSVKIFPTDPVAPKAAPSLEEYEIKTRGSIETVPCSNGGIMFDIEAKNRISIYSLEFGTSASSSNPYSVYCTKSKIPSQKAAVKESDWTLLASGNTSLPAKSKRPQRVSFDAVVLEAGEIIGFYVHVQGGAGVVFGNTKSGHTAENDDLIIRRGCAMNEKLWSSQHNHGDYEFAGRIMYRASAGGRKEKASPSKQTWEVIICVNSLIIFSIFNLIIRLAFFIF